MLEIDCSTGRDDKNGTASILSDDGNLVELIEKHEPT